MADLNSTSASTPPTPEKPFSLTQFIPQSAIDAAKTAMAGVEKGVAEIATQVTTTAANAQKTSTAIAIEKPQTTPAQPETPAAIRTAKEIAEVLGKDARVAEITARTHQDIITRAAIDLDPEKARHDLIAGLQELKKLCDAGKVPGIENPALITEWIVTLEKLQPEENLLSVPRLPESLRDLFRATETPQA